MVEGMEGHPIYESYLDNGYDHVADAEGYCILRDRDGYQVYYDPRLGMISPYGGQVETFRDN